MQDFVRINELDNVAVALSDLKSGREILLSGCRFPLCDEIPRGHKFALKKILQGEPVIKYGFPIGIAKADIAAGSHIHVHNLKTGLGEDLDYEYRPAREDGEEAGTPGNPESTGTPAASDVSAAADAPPVSDVSTAAGAPPAREAGFFMGYERADGRAGVRNELWVLPTVGCVNSIAKAIAGECQDLVRENIEAVVAFAHPYGCSQMGEDQENTRKILADFVKHPNAGGVLVLGLGCENSNIGVLKEYIGEYDENRVRFLQCQDYEDEVEEGVELMRELASEAAKVQRTRVGIGKLVVGLKCGGSDGLSGITANPVVGRFSDLLTAAGGSTILTEVPEMFGAETILMDRCVNREVFGKTVCLINDFKNYFRSHNQTIYENPSPGNKMGGISTLEDKALGCTQKSGTSPVVDVLKYGQSLKRRGLNLLSAPGNDLVASTALAASGAQIVLFTTGRGTPFASAVPTVKISSNSQLAARKRNWIDFDSGRLLEEGMSLDGLGRELLEFVLLTAGGRPVKSERDGYRDLAIFKQGVTL